jgi:hypothetical protein
MSKKIAFVLYSSGLEYDDRVRKEIASLNKLGATIDIFFISPKNLNNSGYTSYGSRFIEYKLHTRILFSNSVFNILKFLEFFLYFKKHQKKYEFIWMHDTELCLFPLFLRKKYIWDLHETPTQFLKNIVLKKIFKLIEARCELIIHANSSRLSYIFKNGIVANLSKHIILRNFADKLFIDSDISSINYFNFKNWLGENDYIYLQGLDDAERFPIETLNAILLHGRMKAVIVGNFNEDIKKQFFSNFGNIFNQTFYFVGCINQLETPQFIKNSKFSILFYSDSNINSYYCEPNRLFQTISLGKPVIIGKNPSIQSIVKDMNLGISIDSFGQNQKQIIDAIELLLNNYDDYIFHVNSSKNNLMWDSQVQVFNFISKHLNL